MGGGEKEGCYYYAGGAEGISLSRGRTVSSAHYWEESKVEIGEVGAMRANKTPGCTRSAAGRMRKTMKSKSIRREGHYGRP